MDSGYFRDTGFEALSSSFTNTAFRNTISEEAIADNSHYLNGSGVAAGDGDGNFSVLPGSESGVKIYGEQRGAALSDFNKDGKVDLAVSQNGADTKLYLNQTQKTGVRIQLNGPEQN